MSPDWAWLTVLALVVPPALGHLYHFVLMVNFGSALGAPEPVMDRMRAALLVVLLITSALLLWMHLRSPWWSWPWPMWTYAVLCVITGTIVGPLNSLIIARRAQPTGILGSSRTLDLAQRDGIDAVVCAGHRGSRALRLPGNESFRLQLREWDLTIPDLSAPLENLRIVQITDLHIAPCYNRRFFESVVSACLGWKPDLVVLTGDLVEDDEVIGWLRPILEPLEARLGKFAILGNHDHEHQPRTITGELTHMGFDVLEGRWTTLDLDGTTLAIGGTSAPWGPAFAASDVPPADFRLLLSHSPDQFYNAQRWRIDLMLSGHNHGGQIRLPLVGPVFMPSRYSRRFDRGFFRENGTLMYVSEGVGGMHPVRYGCPPEVSRFVLKAEIDRPGGESKAARGTMQKVLARD